MTLKNFFVPWFGRIAPAMLRQASYGTIKIGTYQSLKRFFVERPEGEWGILFPLLDRRWVVCLFTQVVYQQRRTLGIKSKQILPKAHQLSVEFRRVTVKRSNLQGS